MNETVTEKDLIEELERLERRKATREEKALIEYYLDTAYCLNSPKEKYEIIYLIKSTENLKMIDLTNQNDARKEIIDLEFGEDNYLDDVLFDYFVVDDFLNDRGYEIYENIAIKNLDEEN